jgi:hypothetical protein
MRGIVREWRLPDLPCMTWPPRLPRRSDSRDLRERLEARAAAERRALSGQVMFLVERALGPEPPRESDEPFAGELLGARRLVEDLARRGLTAEQIAAAVGLDRDRMAAAIEDAGGDRLDPDKLADVAVHESSVVEWREGRR